MKHEERRQELSEFLRSRRARLQPADKGGRVRRRTPGLRREEVAERAFVSLTWYTWLEQGRDIKASHEVLECVARALELDPDETRHLFRLAGSTPSATASAAPEAVTPALQLLLDALEFIPAFVTGRDGEILVWNAAARAVFGDFGALSKGERFWVWWMFMPHARRLMAEWEGSARCAVAVFRADYARSGGDNPIAVELIRNLKEAHPEFAAWWSRHDVLESASRPKTLCHPDAGTLLMEYATYAVNGSKDLRLVTYTPLDEENTPEKLRRLVHQRKPSRKREVASSS